MYGSLLKKAVTCGAITIGGGYAGLRYVCDKDETPQSLLERYVPGYSNAYALVSSLLKFKAPEADKKSEYQLKKKADLTEPFPKSSDKSLAVHDLHTKDVVATKTTEEDNTLLKNKMNTLFEEFKQALTKDYEKKLMEQSLLLQTETEMKLKEFSDQIGNLEKMYKDLITQIAQLKNVDNFLRNTSTADFFISKNDFDFERLRTIIRDLVKFSPDSFSRSTALSLESNLEEAYNRKIDLASILEKVKFVRDEKGLSEFWILDLFPLGISVPLGFNTSTFDKVIESIEQRDIYSALETMNTLSGLNRLYLKETIEELRILSEILFDAEVLKTISTFHELC